MAAAVLLSAVIAPAAGATASGSESQRFIDGLHERRLFRLARQHCKTQLRREDLSDAQRVELTIALCHSFARHAAHAPPSRREALWRGAAETAEQFRRNHPNHPRQLVVELQAALIAAARGELARQEAEVGGAVATASAEALRELSAGAASLRDLDRRIQLRLPTAGANSAGGDLTETELIALRRNVHYHLARALRNQALCFPAESAERADSLLQAEQLLQPLVGLSIDDDVVWRSRIELVGCLRLQGKVQPALIELSRAEKAVPGPAEALRLRAERVRLALAQGSPANAMELLKLGRSSGGRTSPELDLAHVETFLAQSTAARRAGDEQQASRWQSQAADMIKAMERLHGRYWTRRGEMLLASSVAPGGAENIEVLVRTAKNHFLRKEYAEAAAAYQQAGAAARRAGAADQAFDLYYTAALVERRAGRSAAAVQRQRQLAMVMQQHAKAPAVHLQAIVGAAQAARDGTSQSQAAYLELLEEHRQTWPGTAGGGKGVALAGANLRAPA